MIYSAHGRELISKMPMDRVLTESDAPYNIRADIRKTLEGLAGCWNMNSREAEIVIERNFKKLLKGLG